MSTQQRQFAEPLSRALPQGTGAIVVPFAPNERSERIEVEGVLQLIGTIDLSMVKKKLMDPEEGQGWDAEFVDAVETRYKRYLCMLYLDPDGSVVPTKDIDLFWHQHILDTRAYAEDCRRVFGYFVHHFPYFGMRGDDDAADLLSSFEATKVTYRRLFGADYTVIDGGGDSGTCHKCSPTCHKCQSGCSGIKCTTCKSK